MIVAVLALAQVTQVVVYPDRAQVTRVASLPCAARATATFDGLPPSADGASFRAAVSVGSVEGVRAESRTLAESFAPEVQKTEAEMRRLDGEIAALRDRVARAEQSTRLAGGYTDLAVDLIGREMSDAAPNLKAWGGAIDAALAARQHASVDVVDAQAALRARQVRLDELTRARARLGAAAGRRAWRADVLVSCPEGRTAEVSLTYVVGGAGWGPSYEAGGAVELATFATIQQTTGEAWSGVKLILSTALPRRDATPPEVGALRVWAEEREPRRKLLVRREEYHEHAETGTPAGGSGGAARAPHLQAAAQGLSVQLAVPGAAEVAGDGSPTRVLVGRARLPARFALRALPKMMPFAFRVADLTNQAGYPLLPGSLDAYRKSGLIARYRIERVAEGAPLHLTFGIEETLRVRRVVVEEIERDPSWTGSTRRFRFAYRYELGNYLGRADEIEVSDHIPVAELEDVKVTLDERTTPGFEQRADDGIVSWRVKLQPGERRELTLAFHVDVPSRYDGL